MRSVVLTLISLVLTTPVLASDGVVELSQACALNMGCVTGDLPGFPITLPSGSYVLTSDLQTTNVSQFGIDLNGTVTLDFNGFSLKSFPIGGTTNASGIVSSGGIPTGSVAQGSTIKNGTINSFRFNGIYLFAAKGVSIENMVVRFSVSGGGIVVGPNARIIGNRVYGNSDYGIRVYPGSILRDNLAFDTVGGPDIDFVLGSIDYGGNSCKDGSCLRRSYRRYYLSNTYVPATQVPTACTSGFHLASVYELAPGNSLQYDPSLGESTPGNGDTGPPAPFNNFLGWHASGTDKATDTCGGWSTNSSAQTGRAGGFDIDSATGVPTWKSLTAKCDLTAQVWCIED